MLRVLLKVKPGLGEGYDWVECGGCGAGWQVPYYAESVDDASMTTHGGSASGRRS